MPRPIFRRPERAPLALCLESSTDPLSERSERESGRLSEEWERELLGLSSGESFRELLRESSPGTLSGREFQGVFPRESSWNSLREGGLGPRGGALSRGCALGARISTTPIEDRGRIDVDAMSTLCRHSIDITFRGLSSKFAAEVLSKQCRSYVDIASTLLSLGLAAAAATMARSSAPSGTIFAAQQQR